MRKQASMEAHQRDAARSNNNDDIYSLKMRSHSVITPVGDDKEQLKVSESDISGEDEIITGEF